MQSGDRQRRHFTGTSRSRSHSRTRRPPLSRNNSSSHSIYGGTQTTTRRNSASSFRSDDEERDAGNDGHEYDIPAIPSSLDHTLPQEYFKQDLLQIIKNLRIPKWHKLPISVSNDINLKRISGALTNTIYKIDPPSVVILKNNDLHHIVFPPLLLRLYGSNADSIIDRNYELQILARLSRNNIGAKLLGIFNNGRIEQFLDNAITLTKKDIMNLKTSARIARRMRELHFGIQLTPKERQQGPTSLRNIKSWFNQLEELINAGKLTKLNENEVFNTSLVHLKEVFVKYENWITSQYTDINKDLVFCHNDTQYGNLLFSTSPKQTTIESSEASQSSISTIVTSLSNLSLENLTEKIKPTVQEKKQDQNLVVIDFEYSGPNLPAYDISNHFCEWMQNYTHPTESYAVTTDDYPSIEEQLNLIYSYVLFPSQYSKDNTNLGKLDKQAKTLFNDVINWRPAVSLFWALWAILQNGPDDIEKTLDSEIIEEGPNGELYKIIRNGEATSNESDEDDEEVQVEEHEGSVENFEYLKYAKEKMDLFWGDLIQLKIIDGKDQEILRDFKGLKYLNTKYFDI